MKKRSSGAVWGIMLIVCGVLLGGKVLHWFSFDLFFRGWWTLFIIIPSAVHFLTEKGERISALRGLLLGVLLLMAAQGFIEVSMLLPLLIAGILILSGFKMALPKKGGGTAGQSGRKYQRTKRRRRREQAYDGYREDEYYYEAVKDTPPQEFAQDFAQKHYAQDFEEEQQDSGYHFTAEDSPEFWQENKKFEWNEYANRGDYRKDFADGYRDGRTGAGVHGQHRRRSEEFAGRRDGYCACTAVFSGKEIRFRQEGFFGATLSAVFGGIDLDLRDAVFTGNTQIEAIAIFGAVDIKAPDNVRVVVNGTPVFGGLENHVRSNPNLPGDAYTLYVHATCIFGGIEIK